MIVYPAEIVLLDFHASAVSLAYSPVMATGSFARSIDSTGNEAISSARLTVCTAISLPPREG